MALVGMGMKYLLFARKAGSCDVIDSICMVLVFTRIWKEVLEVRYFYVPRS